MTDGATYLLAVRSLEESGGTPVPTGRVATLLDRSPSATTEAIQRLASRGFVEHEPYEGVASTPEGRREVESLWDRHLTLRRFYRDVLGVEEYEREAMEVAAVVRPDVAARLEATLLPPEA